MIIYKCERKECQGTICETSVCPVCGGRARVFKTEIFWCPHCNAPSFYDTCSVCHSHCERIGTDVRPVFPEERLLIEVLNGYPMKFAGRSVWCLGSSSYVVDGKIIRLNALEMRKADPKFVRSELERFAVQNQPFVDDYLESEGIKAFCRINRGRLAEITDEATNYIKSRAVGYSPANSFVSFSGGKDSTVVSHLAMKALGAETIVHIYGDTTLEYPTTHEYVERFKKRYQRTPVIVAKNRDQDFNDLCTKIGPPSRVMRWCCTVFKTGAITKTIESLFSKTPRILTFFGVRRLESVSRSNYERDSDDSKITKQVVCSPIIDWTSFDDWLYILSNKLDFNYAYRQGFSRVGCWCCPNNSSWSGFLSSIYMPEMHENFQNILYDFAKGVGKPDWKEYVDEGKWKARQGGNGLEMGKNTIVTFKPCAFDENAMNFELSRPIGDMLYTLFQPFGIIDRDMGNKQLGEVYVLDNETKQPLLQLRGVPGTRNLRVAILSNRGKFKNHRLAELLVSSQITKFQTCLACGACESVCRFGALTVKNASKGNATLDSVRYKINPTKCRHCLECVNHFDSGCYMKKVLRIKNEK